MCEFVLLIRNIRIIGVYCVCCLGAAAVAVVVEELGAGGELQPAVDAAVVTAAVTLWWCRWVLVCLCNQVYLSSYMRPEWIMTAAVRF